MTKTALITGGSRGIGRACAIELAQAGCNVAITYAGNEAKANETLQELEKLGIKAKAYKIFYRNKRFYFFGYSYKHQKMSQLMELLMMLIFHSKNQNR